MILFANGLKVMSLAQRCTVNERGKRNPEFLILDPILCPFDRRQKKWSPGGSEDTI